MILDGVRTAEIIQRKIAEEVSRIKEDITLAIFMVGNNPASQIYVHNKEKACELVGIKARIYKFDENISQKEIVKVIDECNQDVNVTGIMVQLPLPSHLDKDTILDRIDPNKDVDGLNIINQGKLFNGRPAIEPATAKGIITLLKNNNVDIAGKNAVVIGRSLLVGRPVAMLLMKENATVTICHSKTANLKEITKRADILVVAIGKPKMITEEMVKRDAVVVDVGINRVAGKLCGDVDFENVQNVASLITPVPKGVGPMTIATLLQNVISCYKLQRNIIE